MEINIQAMNAYKLPSKRKHFYILLKHKVIFTDRKNNWPQKQGIVFSFKFRLVIQKLVIVVPCVKCCKTLHVMEGDEKLTSRQGVMLLNCLV